MLPLLLTVMSASERAEMVYECIRGGAEEYLIKPVTRKEVQNIWTHIIRRLNNGPNSTAAGSTNPAQQPPQSGGAAEGSPTPQQLPPAAGQLPASHDSQQHPAGAADNPSPSPLPVAAHAHIQCAGGPSAAAAASAAPAALTLGGSTALPPLPSIPSPAASEQQRQQQQLASSLALAAAATAAGQQPWQPLALHQDAGSTSSLPPALLAGLAGPQQLQHQGQRGAGGHAGSKQAAQPHAKRVRLQDGSSAGLGAGAQTAARAQGPAGPLPASGGEGRGELGALGHGASAEGLAEFLGGEAQGGLATVGEAAGRGDREAGLGQGFGAEFGGAGGGAGEAGHSVIPLSSWLARPNRVVQPKESFWIFTEVRGL